ncbi:MAG: pilus assembly protein PilP [Casimicrobiaceae bacterium]|nr:pilus assembly protein PilP [Casimicrobiaceae bacterium]MDW8311899.1 pilus assembly protein PilP [Burkholderiales bacterium]
MLFAVGLTACAGSDEQELRAWMEQQGQNMRGRIEPIPSVRTYETFTYTAAALPDPFKPRKLETGKGSMRGPDLTRRREALEAYPLETLTMVGTIQQGSTTIGLVRTKENRVFQVRPGNYMGQNFGVITAITDNEITLKELYQDGAGDWVERQTKLQLQQQEQKK